MPGNSTVTFSSIIDQLYDCKGNLNQFNSSLKEYLCSPIWSHYLEQTVVIEPENLNKRSTLLLEQMTQQGFNTRLLTKNSANESLLSLALNRDKELFELLLNTLVTVNKQETKPWSITLNAQNKHGDTILHRLAKVKEWRLLWKILVMFSDIIDPFIINKQGKVLAERANSIF